MKKILLALPVLLLYTGCTDDSSEEAVQVESATETPATAPTTMPPATPAVSDAQIAGIVVAANQVDIDAGRLAAERSSDPRVQEFATRMVTDHTGVNQAASELVARLGVTPAPSPVSESLTDDGATSRQSLQGQSGAAFDRAYIANEVTYHQAVLDALDQTLIPNAQNAELKALLEQSRPAFVAHLEHARTLQSSLGAAQ